MKTYYVYMLRCSDCTLYTGSTSDLDARMAEHASGICLDSYTKSRRPVKLVYLADFIEVHQAIEWERRIKRWSRKKKEALVRGDYDVLPELAENLRRRHIGMIRNTIRKRVMVSPVEPWHVVVSPFDRAQGDTTLCSDSDLLDSAQCDTANPLNV